MISNAGLTLILKFSIPVLVAIYPLAIVLIALGLINLAWKNLHLHRWVYPLSMLFTGVVSVAAGLEAFGLNVPFCRISAQISRGPTLIWDGFRRRSAVRQRGSSSHGRFRMPVIQERECS